jgi:uncharacterized protein
MTNALCIYHKDCADGLGAAWAVHRALGIGVDFVAAKYGDAPPVVIERDVLVVDFSYPRIILEEMTRNTRSVLVLDHHKTAQQDLAGLCPAPETTSTPGLISTTGWQYWQQFVGTSEKFIDTEADKQFRHNLATVFDMERSGAGITWDFMCGLPRSPIINLIEDRDLWRFRLDDSRKFHAALTSYNIEDLSIFNDLDEWHNSAVAPDQRPDFVWDGLLAEGAAILRAQQQAVHSAVSRSRRTMLIAGQKVPVANVSGMVSEAGHLLCNTSWDTNSPPPPFSATYYDGADGKRHFSLRSSPYGADVGAIAKSYGGGGHEHAAGFDMPIGWEGE